MHVNLVKGNAYTVAVKLTLDLLRHGEIYVPVIVSLAPHLDRHAHRAVVIALDIYAVFRIVQHSLGCAADIPQYALDLADVVVIADGKLHVHTPCIVIGIVDYTYKQYLFYFIMYFLYVCLAIKVVKQELM